MVAAAEVGLHTACVGPQFGLDPLEIVVGGFTSDQCWSFEGEEG